MEFNVITTQGSYQEIGEIIKSMESNATGYAGGIEVTEDDNVPGKYILAFHNGEITDRKDCIRVIDDGNDRKIMTKNLSTVVENQLRSRQIPFEGFKIDIPNPNDKNPTINLPKEAGLSYSP